MCRCDELLTHVGWGKKEYILHVREMATLSTRGGERVIMG